MDFIRDMEIQTDMVSRYANHVVYLVSHIDIA